MSIAQTLTPQERELATDRRGAQPESTAKEIDRRRRCTEGWG
jgi:hypothetical protein